MKPQHRLRRDQVGVLRPVDEHGTHWSSAAEWGDAFEHRHGGTASANLRTVSKGSSRGVGPQKKQGRVHGRGGAADNVKLCTHGNRAAQCGGCSGWYCGCPGSVAHSCSGAA